MRLFILAIKFKNHLERMDNDNPLKYYFNILKLKKIKSSKSLASKILKFNFMEYKYFNILPYEYKIVNKNKNKRKRDLDSDLDLDKNDKRVMKKRKKYKRKKRKFYF